MSLADKLNEAASGGPRAFLSDEIADVTLDTVLDISKSINSQVTRHAIERGADVTDHVIDDPETWSLSVVLTNDSISALDPLSFGGQTIEERLAILDEWRTAKQIISYYGPEETIDDVIIASRSESRNAEIGLDGLQLSITLQRITLAEAVSIDLEVKQPIPQQGRAASGSSSSTSTEAPAKKSMLRSLY